MYGSEECLGMKGLKIFCVLQTEQDILVREELEEMAEKSDNFSLWYTLDRPTEGRGMHASRNIAPKYFMLESVIIALFILLSSLLLLLLLTPPPPPPPPPPSPPTQVGSIALGLSVQR